MEVETSQSVTAMPVAAPAASWTLPLPVALRTAAAEVRSSQLRSALEHLALRLDQGEPLESALNSVGQRLPRFVRALLEGAARTAQPGQIFARYVAQSQETAEVQRFLRMSFLTPVLLIAFTAGILMFTFGWVIPRFKAIFSDFGTELPGLTVVAIELSDFLVVFLPFFLVPLALLFVVLVILIAGARLPAIQPVAALIPIIGGALRKLALSDYCEYLALLVQCRTPLPDAMELASRGAGSAGLWTSSRHVANALRNGVPVEDVMHRATWFPGVLRNAFRHATDQTTFLRLLEGLRDVFRSEAQRNSMLIPMVVVPLVVMGVGIVLLFVVLSLFLPLIKLLNDLS